MISLLHCCSSCMIKKKNVPQQTLNITDHNLDLRFDRKISVARDSCKYQTRQSNKHLLTVRRIWTSLLIVRKIWTPSLFIDMKFVDYIIFQKRKFFLTLLTVYLLPLIREDEVLFMLPPHCLSSQWADTSTQYCWTAFNQRRWGAAHVATSLFVFTVSRYIHTILLNCL
jgi:hypothetical protein